MEASEYAAWTIDTPLDCEECIADTPRYRHQLRLKEQHISHIESRLSRVLKACNEMLKQSDKYGDSVVSPCGVLGRNSMPPLPPSSHVTYFFFVCLNSSGLSMRLRCWQVMPRTPTLTPWERRLANSPECCGISKPTET
eukprot:m.89134 g.89134  ORF g.89134 m.89134 type:complete len:139 (+) comp11707_c0_seq1:252-668(+)